MSEHLSQSVKQQTYETRLVEGEPVSLSWKCESGIVATNKELGISQEALALVVAGGQEFVVCRVQKNGHVAGFSVSIPTTEKNGRAILLGTISSDNKELVVGRTHQAVFSDNEYLSRNHFSVRFNALGEPEFSDLGSTNGTKLILATKDAPRFEGLEWAAKSKDLLQSFNLLTDADNHQTAKIGNLALDLARSEGTEGYEILSKIQTDRIVNKAVESNALNAELVRRMGEAMPKNGIEIDGKKFVFSDVFYDKEHAKSILVAFAENDDGKIYPRLFYKSNSDGGWRSCPGVYYSRGQFTYSKGTVQDKGGYVWGTKPAEQIIKYIEDRMQKTGQQVERRSEIEINDIFNESILDREGLYTFDSESHFNLVSDDPEVTKSLYGAIDPGVGFEVPSDEARFLLETMKLPEGFMPDFNLVSRRYTFNHTLLGKTEVTVHEAILNGKKVHWHIAKSSDGHIWIDKIVYVPAMVNSYGTYEKVILAGALALKPLEYDSQVKGLDIGIDYQNTQHRDYVSLRPTIERMPWAKAYRSSFNT